MAADRKLLVSLVVGTRTKDQTHALVGDAKSRLRAGHLPVLLSDGYEGYAPAMLDAFARRYPLLTRVCRDVRAHLCFGGPKGWRMGR